LGLPDAGILWHSQNGCQQTIAPDSAARVRHAGKLIRRHRRSLRSVAIGVTSIAIRGFDKHDLPEAAMRRIPLSVLTGFLGSGKTTLLRRLLTHPRLADAAVVINEVGEIGVDDAIVREVSEGVVLLASGCLCCSMRQDLVTTLRSLYRQRATGAIPRFGRLVVETTGLADPAPILHTLVKDALVADRFRLDGMIVTFDAVHALEQLDRHAECIRQAAFADRAVITKVDLATPQAVRVLEERLASLNRFARILHSVLGEIDPDVLLDAGLYNRGTGAADVDRWLHGARNERPPLFRGSTGQGAHDDGIRAFALVFEEPLDWEPFADTLERFISERGQDVLRVKGILNVASEARPVVVHGVQHVFYPPQSLARWPGPDRRSRLVFITSRIERDVVEHVFRMHNPVPRKSAFHDGPASSNEPTRRVRRITA
jgi:G3E family GTPase